MPLDRAQFRDLFDAERDRVHRFLWRLTRNATDADDLLQDAFLAAWRNRRQFQARGSSTGWLLRTAYRLYLNHRRKRVRREGLAAQRDAAPLEGDANGAERSDAMDFLVRRVSEAVTRLPEGPREAFVMFRVEGMSVPEIASVVACSPKTIETRIRRATQLLARDLAPLREHLPA
jgi:RNA polymerase sigma-70 factor (ECF subfamily)